MSILPSTAKNEPIWKIRVLSNQLCSHDAVSKWATQLVDKVFTIPTAKLYTIFIQLLAALDCKPHLNIGYLRLWDFRMQARFAFLANLVMILTPQLRCFIISPPVTECARDAEEKKENATI